MTTSWTKIADNPASWSNVPKPIPITSVITNNFTGGDPMGLLLALTYSQITQSSIVTGIWTKIAEPIGTSYTKIAKAT